MRKIEQIRSLLKQGQVVGFPTETVYGLAVNALDQSAVSTVFELKGRPAFNPLIVHIRNKEEIDRYCQDVNPIVYQLAEHYWPGPLTLILKSNGTIPSIVTGGQNTIGLRVPAHPLALELLYSIDFPLAVPSANPYHKVSATLPEHIAEYFGPDFPVLNGGACRIGIESTVLSLVEHQAEILRHGSITEEQIKKDFPGLSFINDTQEIFAENSNMIHYAPKTPIYLNDPAQVLDGNLKLHHRIAYLNFTNEEEAMSEQFTEFLFDDSENLEEIARGFYQTLFKIDQNDFDAIFCRTFPETGIGIALNDKLRKAAVKCPSTETALS